MGNNANQVNLVFREGRICMESESHDKSMTNVSQD
jgi:hypothetical protein